MICYSAPAAYRRREASYGARDAHATRRHASKTFVDAYFCRRATLEYRARSRANFTSGSVAVALRATSSLAGDRYAYCYASLLMPVL